MSTAPEFIDTETTSTKRKRESSHSEEVSELIQKPISVPTLELPHPKENPENREVAEQKPQLCEVQNLLTPQTNK